MKVLFDSQQQLEFATRWLSIYTHQRLPHGLEASVPNRHEFATVMYVRIFGLVEVGIVFAPVFER